MTLRGLAGPAGRAGASPPDLPTHKRQEVSPERWREDEYAKNLRDQTPFVIPAHPADHFRQPLGEPFPFPHVQHGTKRAAVGTPRIFVLAERRAAPRDTAQQDVSVGASEVTEEHLRRAVQQPIDVCPLALAEPPCGLLDQRCR